MNDPYDTLEDFQQVFPWGSEWNTLQTPKHKPNRGFVVGWIWNEHSYGVVLDNEKWKAVRSYAPSLLQELKED